MRKKNMLIKKWWDTYSDFELDVAVDIWDEYKTDLGSIGIDSLDKMIQDRGLFKSLIQNFWSTRLDA
jgi:hypothetical protein